MREGSIDTCNCSDDVSVDTYNEMYQLIHIVIEISEDIFIV